MFKPACVLCLIAQVLAFATASAQSGRATIGGAVTDQSGAVVPAVEVTATHEETNVATSTRSNNVGLYSILNLPPGPYTVTFRKDGFSPYTRRGVTVGLTQVVQLDVSISIGTLADTVTVNADVPLIQTASAEVGSSMKSEIVTDLPLNISGGRALENFAYAITPSVEGNNWTSYIAGSAPFSKEVVIDGTSAVIQIGGHVGETSPSMEAVEEFKVQTSGIAAEYGRTGGGIFNFSLKSGTNTLHGSGYGYFRNEALNANTWQNKFLAAATPARRDEFKKPRDRQNIGGTSIGGPIVRNKTFAFGAFEEYSQSRFVLGGFNRTVPITPFLDGDFSALLDRGVQLGTDGAGNPIYRGAIFDPRTGLVFPGNRIPSDRISAVSRKIADIYREAYQPMIGGRLTNNSASTLYNDPDFRQRQISAKVDHNFSTSSRLSGSFIWTQRPRTLVDAGGIWDPADTRDMGGPLSKSRRQDVGGRQARISHTLTLSPNLLHVANVNYSRYKNPSVAGSHQGGWPEKLGFGDVGIGNFPEIGFGAAVNGISMTPIGYNNNSVYAGDSSLFSDSVSWVKGRHVFKFGGEFRHLRMHSYPQGPVLSFAFGNDYTGRVGQPWSNQVGFGFASFLLGGVDSASQGTSIELNGRRNYVALYAQDDFRPGDRLTLNLGLRWETTGPWTEKNGRWANFDTSAVNPALGVPGVLEFANDGKTSFEGDRDLKEFGPRAGLTYQFNERVVVRSAYGVFYSPVGMNFWSGVPYGFAPGFAGTNRVNPVGGGRSAFNWDNGYPGQFVAGTLNPNFTQWGMVSVNPQSLHAGMVQQWNVGTELGVTSDFVVDVSYLGNKGSDLQTGDLERNQPDPDALGALLRSGKEWNWVADAASAAANGVPYPYAGFANYAFFALMPFPQAAQDYGPLFYVGSPLGSSSYHALQLTATKRMSHGVSANASYTLSRSRGNIDTSFQERWTAGSIQDVRKLDEEANVIDPNDRTHVFKGYIAWELPFGSGRRFMSGAGPVANALVSGWSVSSIFRYHSGTPLRVVSNNSYTGWSTFGYPIYANVDPNADLRSQFDPDAFDQTNTAAAGNRYFDPKAFSNPSYGQLGAGPGFLEQLRGFGGAYEDLGIMKNIRGGDRYRVQIRFELINAFNRRYFADPVTSIGNPLFGQVISTTGQPRQGQLGLRLEW
jgi:hypothetical protein